MVALKFTCICNQQSLLSCCDKSKKERCREKVIYWESAKVDITSSALHVQDEGYMVVWLMLGFLFGESLAVLLLSTDSSTDRRLSGRFWWVKFIYLVFCYCQQNICNFGRTKIEQNEWVSLFVKNNANKIFLKKLFLENLVSITPIICSISPFKNSIQTF